MKSIILLISLFILMPVVLRAGKGNPTTDAEQPVDVEALFPSEEGLIRIEVPGVDSRDFLARFVGDTLFVPINSLCDFLRIKCNVSADQNLITGEMPPEGDFEISRISNAAHIGTRTVNIAASTLRIVGGEEYIEQSLFAEILGIVAYYDPTNLKLRISPDEKVPVVQWKRNEERYGLLSPHERSEAAVNYPIDRSFFGAPAINWTLGNSINGSITSSAAAIFYGQQLLWGTFEMNAAGSLTTGLPTAGVAARIDAARWYFQMPTSDVLTQVQLGALDLPSGQRVQGAGITNVPLSPRTGYDTYLLQGFTRPGWTVELYDGGRLVDVTRGGDDGRYEFKIQMGYGTVDRTTRQVGPYGESIIEHHRLQFDQGMIPAGQVEYDVRYGADSLRLHSTGAGSARVGFGLIDRVTVGAEAAYQTSDIQKWNTDSIQPRALASIWLGEASSLAFSYGVRTKLVSGSFSTFGTDNTTLHASLDSFSLTDHTFGSTLSASLPIGPITLGASGGYYRHIADNAYEVEPQISGYVGGIGFLGSTRFTWAKTPTGEVTVPGFEPTSGPGITSALRLSVAPFSGVLVSAYGKYDVRRAELTQFDISGYYQFNEQLGLTIDYSAPKLDWRNGLVQAELSLNLHAFRAMVGSFYHDGSVSTSSFAQGGALISTHGVKLYSDPVVGQSAVLIEAFNDRNGNGMRDDGEESLDAPKAWIKVAESEMMSEDGMFRLLPANRECQVEIDRWSLASDELYPGRTRYNIYTLPSGVHMLEVPFAHGYDISGRCGIEGDSAHGNNAAAFLNGLRVTLTTAESDASYEGEVYSDGTIFVPGVAAGTYKITFDADQLAARRLCPPGTEPTFTMTATEHHIPTVLLRRCAK